MAAVLPKVNDAPRGRDRKKADFEWHAVEKVMEFDDGWYLGYLGDHRDIATLGKLMGHCSGTHFIWACEEKIWYFFALFDKDDVPHGTLHAKEKKWVGKAHPRDNGEHFPVANYGAAPGKITLQVGGYPPFQAFLDAFKAAGLEYEPGKYRPIHYNSQTYDYNINRGGGGGEGFDARWYDPFNGRKPDGIDDETWAGYTKAWKALKDTFNKNQGIVKINGRTFKFDGKELIVLSFADKSHYEGKIEYRKMIAEWLNSLQKSKRKEAVA